MTRAEEIRSIQEDLERIQESAVSRTGVPENLIVHLCEVVSRAVAVLKEPQP